MPYTRKTKSKNKRRTIKGGTTRRSSSSRSSSSRSSSRSSSSRSSSSRSSSRSSSSNSSPFSSSPFSSSSSRSSSSRSSLSTSSSSTSSSEVEAHTWTDLKKVLENSNPLLNLNLYHGNDLKNLLNDVVEIAKKFTKKEKKQIKEWISIEEKKDAPVSSDAQITIWKGFLNNFSNRIK